MKIVYIIKSFAIKAGVERVMCDKMNWLAEHGYEITMVTYEQGVHPLAFSLHQSIRHIDLDTRFFTIEKFGYPQRFFMMQKMRCQFQTRLQALFDEIHPDIIVTTTYSIKLIDIILSVKSVAYRIIESHVACYTIKKAFDYRNKFFLRLMASLYDKMILSKVSKADCLVALTKGDAADWIHYNSNVIVIPNPVTYIPKTILPHDGSGHKIICVGRLHEQKGFDLLIDAFKLIADNNPGWKIEIYGDGTDKALLLEKIQKYNLQDRIQLMAPTSAIYDEYQKSEFLVLSSRYEGYPLVLNEAMSCGIPCVAFRCKYGPEEAIIDGVNGLLVDNCNVEDLSQKMLWMMTHTKERFCMGSKARDAAYRYEKSVIMNLWTDLFEKLSNVKRNKHEDRVCN